MNTLQVLPLPVTLLRTVKYSYEVIPNLQYEYIIRIKILFYLCIHNVFKNFILKFAFPTEVSSPTKSPNLPSITGGP